MKTTLRIQNFKSLKDVTIELKPLTFLFGPNGSGKSSIMQALNFFKEELKQISLSSFEELINVNSFKLSGSNEEFNFQSITHNNKITEPITFSLRVTNENIVLLNHLNSLLEKELFFFDEDKDKLQIRIDACKNSLFKSPNDILKYAINYSSLAYRENTSSVQYTFFDLINEQNIDFEFVFSIRLFNSRIVRNYSIIDHTNNYEMEFIQDRRIQHPLTYGGLIFTINSEVFNDDLNMLSSSIVLDSNVYDTYMEKVFFSKKDNLSILELLENLNSNFIKILERNYEYINKKTSFSLYDIYSAYVINIVFLLTTDKYLDIMIGKDYKYLAGIRDLPEFEYNIKHIFDSYYTIPYQLNFPLQCMPSVFQLKDDDQYSISLVDKSELIYSHFPNSVMLDRFVNYIGIAKNIKVNIENDRYFQIILVTKDNYEINLSLSSSGVKQIIPVLFFLSAYDNVCIEQPELHLHPKLQSLLTDLFVKRVNEGRSYTKTIIETHSEHMIRKVQVMIAKKELKLDEVAVYYFTKDDKSGSIAKNLVIDENGNFQTKWPHGFFDERSDLVYQLIEAQTQRKN